MDRVFIEANACLWENLIPQIDIIGDRGRVFFQHLFQIHPGIRQT
ncbi:MAG: hypothetical protein ACP5D7_06025 [Limnospira sp.]